MANNNETKFTIEVELAGDSKQVQQAIKDGLSKDFSAKIGADTSKLSRDINTAIKELNSSDKKVKIGIDGSNIVKDINNALKSIESDSLKKVKLGTDTSNLLRDINKAITTINSSDSLKKLKLGVDVNYLQQQLNKALRSLDTTVKLKTKLETTSRTSETKGTVTTNKTSKEEAQQYQSLFSKRAASISNLDRAYQEFGRNSKEVSAAIREFAAASKDVRKFGRDTGVLSLNKVKSDIERQLGAGLTTDFTKNWLRMEYDKVLKDIDNLDRQLKPEKYEKIQAKAEYQRLDAEHKDLAAQLKAVADAYKAEAAEVRRRIQELKFSTDVAKGVSKGTLKTLADSAKLDNSLDSNKMDKFMEELQNYRNLTGNYRSSYFYNLGRELGITEGHPYFPAMQKLYQSNLDLESKWRQKPITANVDVKGSEKVEELNQKILTTTQQFMRLRGEALKAGNALNQATDPKDIARLKTEFEKAIQALVNYQRATRGLTKGGEAQLVEKLAVGNIKEQTEAWKVLYEWVKKTVQAQRDYDIGVGRKLPRKNKDTDLMSYFKNLDWGRALSGMAYAARGELNTVQAFGNLLSSMSQISGVVGTLAKGLGAFFAVGLAVAGVINVITSAFTQLTSVLGQVATTIYNILRPGIELYKQRQTAELAVAAAISSRAREEGQRVPFERGLEISKELMQRVIIDAAKSAFNPQELIDALRGTLPLAFGKGMNLEQAYDLTKGVASVAKVINLAPNQVLQELRDILQGTISARSSQVAGATGMTGEELREAEAQGRLYEYISEHLKNFTIALNKYAETLAGALDRLSETWAMGMEAVFQRLAPVVNNLLNAFVDNFIGVYKDKNTGEIIDTSNSENLKNPETGEYRELVSEFSIYIKQFASALEDLIIFIAPIIDEILEFIQELTGQADPINAVTVLIEYAIRIAVTLGEVLVQMIFDMAEALTKWEKPIAWLLGFIKGTAKATYHLDEALLELGITIQNVLYAIWKFITRIGSWDDVGKAASEGINNVNESSKKMMEDIKQSFTTTSYDELLGVDRGERPEKGLIERLVDEAREKAQAEENKKAGKPVDYSAVQGMAKENKQNLADLKKAMQEAIEKIKQELKEALAKLKDIAEQNELAYRQGYKSIEDYFSQKAQLEYEEALLKVAALQREIEEVQKLNTGGDAGAQYQKERDLVRLSGELNLEQRNLNKKADQRNELLGAIAHNTAINSYQQGLGYNNVSFSRANAGSAISAYGNEVSSILTNSLNNQDMINFESAMQHGTEGCVEFADRFLAQFDNFFKEMLDSGVFDTDVLIEHAREAGMQIQDATEEAIRAVQAGDIIFADTGTGFKNGHTLVVLSNNNGAIQVAANASSTYDNANGSYMLNSGEEHIRTYDLDSYLGDSYSASTIIKSGERIAQSLNLMENASEQFAQDVRESTNRVEQIRQDIDNSYQDIQARMPRAYSQRVEEYYKAVQDGQTRWLEALSKYNSMMNDNASMLIAVEASVAATAVKLKREAQIFGTQFANQFPELKETLEKMIPIEVLKVEAKIWEQKANERLQMIEDDAKAVNKKLREKSWLFPQAIEQYMSYFQKIGTKDGAYTITDQLQQMAKVADELAKQGVISEARNISKKIIELRSKFSNMIQSWIDEMGNYFNYRKELVNADSGLPSFVKEERVKQLEKGEARAKAVAYGQEAMEWAKLEVKYQEQLDKVLAHKNEELDKTMSADADILRMNIADLEIAKQRAMRQAEINAKLGEQKTLWQQTMDAANEALQNGLYNFMTDYINTAESIGEAFRNMAIDILKDLQKFFAKKAITDLMHVIVGEPNEQYNVPNHAETQTAVNTGQMVAWLQNIHRAVLTLQTTQSSSVFTNVGGTAMGVLSSSGTGGSNSIANRILHHATGGYISGKGTSTSDSIPAMLSNGEYVIKADSVRRYGLNFLDAVNSGHFTRMRTVIPRFADGGYVGDALQDTARGMTDFAKNLGTSVGVDNTISIALVRDEQEAIREWAKSPSGGQKFLVDFAKGNGRVFSRFNR